MSIYSLLACVEDIGKDNFTWQTYKQWVKENWKE